MCIPRVLSQNDSENHAFLFTPLEPGLWERDCSCRGNMGGGSPLKNSSAGSRPPGPPVLFLFLRRVRSGSTAFPPNILALFCIMVCCRRSGVSGSNSECKFLARSRYSSVCVCARAHVLSCVQLFVTLWTVAARLCCPWDSPGKNTGMGCHFLLRGIFPTQGSNLHLLRLLQILYH